MSGALFTARVERGERWTAVVCSGDLDAPGNERFTDAVCAALEQRPPLLVLDCRAVGFAGSYGLKLLLDAIVRCEEEAVEVVLLAGADIRRLFELIGVPLLDHQGEPAGAWRPGPLVHQPPERPPRSRRREWEREQEAAAADGDWRCQRCGSDTFEVVSTVGG